MIVPEIWESEQISRLSDFQFRIYIGLISAADDEGRLTANPMVLTAKIFPRCSDPSMVQRVQETIVNLENCRDEKDGSPLIGLYQIGNAAYIYHPNWIKHQKISPSKKSESKLPVPPDSEKYTEKLKLVTAYGYDVMMSAAKMLQDGSKDAASVQPFPRGGGAQRKKERKKE